MTVGNGSTARFWEDRWLNGKSVCELMPQLYTCIPKRRRKNRTVVEGLLGNSWARDIHGVIGVHEIGQYLQLWQLAQQVTLPTELDKLTWKWTTSGVYTAQSAYLATFQGSTTCFSWKLIWKNWVPPKVKFFHWLACQDRCWTAEHLARHGMQHHPRCLLCDQAPETRRHLMLECPFARQTWHEVLAWLRMTAAPPDHEASPMDWWLQARQNTSKPLHKGLASAALLVPWMIWKHRNACVFEGARSSSLQLISNIKE
uniref:Reverse transcriptase zinc-binding domain-containing protein n=1 Tax=Hordeum vulgare subsp. vulgare TaxID=112509 RepID=A0A8I6WC10_HORVV